MKRNFVRFMLYSSAGIIFCFSLWAKNISSPLGYWLLLDGNDDKPRAIVRLQIKKNKVEGRIVRVYHQERDYEYCVKCPAPFKNERIEGLKFLWGMSSNGSKAWSGGKILDPMTGKIYKGKFSLSKAGKKIYLRGYWAISLFGRTMTLVRRSAPD